ncbi:MAG: hypothetical protein NOU37_01370 [Candidatus Brocadiales bacterium]|nr:hypothetical protein [Candidatus Bathyanammoxibius amoris]
MGTIFEMSVGIFGLTLLLTAFIMGNFWGRGQNVLHYQIMNFIGGVILAWYAFQLRYWMFATLETARGTFALYSLVLCIRTMAKKSKVPSAQGQHT